MIDQTQVQQRVSFTMLTLLVKCLTGGLPIIQLKCFNFLISAPSPRYSRGEPALVETGAESIISVLLPKKQDRSLLKTARMTDGGFARTVIDNLHKYHLTLSDRRNFGFYTLDWCNVLRKVTDKYRVGFDT